MDITLNPSRQTLNDIQASGADFKLVDRGLKIGNTGNFSPDINYLSIASMQYRRSQVNEGNRFVIAVTLVALAAHSFQLRQNITDNGAQPPFSRLVEYTPIAGETLANVTAKLTAIVNAYISAGQLTGVTVTDSGTSLTIVGMRVECNSGENCVATRTNRVIALNATPATAIAGTATVTITTLAAHGLTTGNVVSLTAATGYTFTNLDKNGQATLAFSNDVTITVTGATTFTLRGVTGSGTNTGTAVLTIVPSEAIGQGAEILANPGREFVQPIKPLSGSTYTTVDVEFGGSITALNTVVRNQEGRHLVYMKEDATNFASAITRLNEIKQAYVVGGTTADPETVAVG